jgi:hypothetical protein
MFEILRAGNQNNRKRILLCSYSILLTLIVVGIADVDEIRCAKMAFLELISAFL